MFFNHNGNLVEVVQIDINNRSFLYGDGLFERLRLFNGKVFNRKNHEQRLTYSLEQLKLTLSTSINNLFDQVEQLAQQNHFSNSSGARITIYRNSGGMYTPVTQSASYIIESIHQDMNYFFLGDGIKLGVYNTHFKAKSVLSNIKSSSANLYVLSSLEKKRQSLDELILLNENKRVVEGSNSNLFIVKNGIITTPPLSEGPLGGCMRSLLIEQFNIIENTIKIDDVQEADEVFFSNCNGIRWVNVFGSKTCYQNKISNSVIEFLNTLI